MSERSALLAHPDARRLARELARRPGAIAGAGLDVRRAAVLLVLRPAHSSIEPAADPSAASSAEADGLELLFIKRAEYEGDPWSGQVAFPGGRQEPQDATLRETAIRETWEETAVDVARDGIVLGTLDELWPRTPVLPPIVVRPYVAMVAPDVRLVLSEEVAAAFWAPLDALRHPDATFEATVMVRGEERRVPALRHAEYTIWGMTERIFRDFLTRLAQA